MKISIITINYNNMGGLKPTIDSVISQNYIDKEFIIIDGGSSDGSKELIERNVDFITKWVSEPDSGIYNAMNKGVSMSTGDYLIFMNSGDEFYDANVLSNVSAILEKSNKVEVLTGVTFNKGDDTSLWYPPKQLTLHYFLSSSISHQASFIRRELLLKFPYNETNKIVSDWEFWLQTIIFSDCSYITTDIVICNYDRSGMSNTQYGRLITEREQVLKRVIPSRILSDYKMMSYNNNRESPFVQTALQISAKSGTLSLILNKLSKFCLTVYCKYKGIEI